MGAPLRTLASGTGIEYPVLEVASADYGGRRTGMERKLSAILAADVVGYSRLMGEDEVGTLARLQSYRLEVVDPAIAEFRGRIIKLIGDGALVEFASVV